MSGGDRSVSLIGNPQLSGAGQNGTDRGLGFSINGQRASGTEILLDGAENSNLFDTTVGLLIPQDATQEFRVITNNFDAQYGRASGGVVNVVTKSGSNSFHGAAWEYNRLSAYTANTFDNNANAIPKGQYTRNQFGYDVGGPVKKNKLFFYQSTEWLRVRSSASVLTYVPTPQFLALTAPNVQAFFNAFGNQAFNFVSTVPKTTVGGTPFVGSTAGNPGGPFASNVPDGTPVFGLVSFSAPVDAGGDAAQNTYLLVARADYNLSDKTQMFFRFGRESLLALPGSVFAGPYPEYNVGQTILNNNYLLSVSHTFTSNLLSSTKLSFFRDNVSQQYNQSLQNTPTLYLYNNATLDGQPVQLPGFSDFTTGTGGLPFGGPQNSVQVNQDLSWTKGKHTMKYGGQVNYIQMNRGFGAYAQAVDQLGKNARGGPRQYHHRHPDQLHRSRKPGRQVPVRGWPLFRRQQGQPYRDPRLHGGSATWSAQLQPQRPVQRLGSVRGGQLEGHDKIHAQLRPRYEHYGVQHNNDPKLDSNLYYGSGSTIFEQIHNGSMLTVPNSPIGELWKPTWGTIGPRVSASRTMSSATGRPLFAADTASPTKGTSATSHST